MLCFQLTDEQVKKLRKWQDTHKCKFRVKGGTLRYVGSFGGEDTFCFTPTSIGGMFTVVRCACGAEVDLTEDFSKW